MEDEDEIDAAFYQDCINIEVKGQDGFEASYMIRRTDPLRILMDKYCLQYGLDVDGVGFSFDERLARAEDTPYKLGIEDGDEILVTLHLRARRVYR